MRQKMSIFWLQPHPIRSGSHWLFQSFISLWSRNLVVKYKKQVYGKSHRYFLDCLGFESWQAIEQKSFHIHPVTRRVCQKHIFRCSIRYW
jgi:hypothetical protein